MALVRPRRFSSRMNWRVELTCMFERQRRALGQRGVQDHRVRARDQHAGRVAGAVAHDLAAGRVGRVPGVADHAQRGAVEQRAVVQVQHEHRVSGRGGVDVVQRRHALFGELEFVPAAHHAHPLRIRRALGLRLAACAARRPATARLPSAAPGCTLRPPRIRCRCESFRPGMTVRPFRSITCVAAPRWRMTSSASPTAVNFPSRTATALACGLVLSTV